LVDGDVLSVPHHQDPDEGSCTCVSESKPGHTASSRPSLLALIATAIATTVRPPARRPAAETIKVGLITKDVTNPFFVKMKAGQQRQRSRMEPSSSTRPAEQLRNAARSPRSKT
jgi:hypothetical protein